VSTSHDQRLPIRLLNGAMRLAEKLGRRTPGFAESLDSLRAEAVAAATGITGTPNDARVADADFGPDDFNEPLALLARAYDEESKLNPFGRMMIHAQLTGVLRARLETEAALNARPELRERPVERPIFVLGLPRTGTTALHHILQQDPANQVLEYWLAASPMPRPPRASWPDNPRYKEAAKGLSTMYWLDPSLKAIHLLTADGAEECRHLLQQTFRDDTFECNSTLPSYSAWYAACDMVPAYRRHRDVLRVIDSGNDVGGSSPVGNANASEPTTGTTVPSDAPARRWVLKYPAHLRHLEALLEVYPDACIVQTHRDPARVLPSLCSLVAGWRGIYEDDPDRPAIARWLLELWASTMEQAMEVRLRLGSERFFDLAFEDIVADPLAAVRRTYAHFGLAAGEQAEDSIARFARENPRGKHGEHRYSAADFGLTETMMHDRFAGYLEHFEIRTL
jgi:hypothetical protein